jgi:hypothetical protein
MKQVTASLADFQRQPWKRIMKGIEEINITPIVHRWKKFTDDSRV